MKTYTIFFIFLAIAAKAQVGIGTLSPQEKLEVNGAVKIGTTSNTNVGTIRWNGSDFEGYDGTKWASLTTKKVSINLKNSTNITFLNYVETPLVLNTILYNYGGGNYNTITGSYTVPYNGVYKITPDLSIKYSNTTPFLIMTFEIYINGFLREVRTQQKKAYNTGYVQGFTFDFSMDLNTNDIITFKYLGVWGTANPAPYITHLYTRLSITKI